MEILVGKAGNTAVVQAIGRVDATNSADLEKSLLNLIENEQEIVINCSRLDYMSSSGLRVLLAASKKAKNLEHSLVLCNLNDNIREIFEISGFSAIIKIYPTEEEALKK